MEGRWGSVPGMAAGWFEEMKQRRVFRALVGYTVLLKKLNLPLD